jgi:predicted ATPase/DNA-binding SARP family transcriptional activator
MNVLWGDDLPGNPGNSLQVQVAQLRRMLGRSAILTREGGYALDADLDLDAFEALVERGRGLLAGEETTEAARVLSDALSMCRGEPLADFRYADFAMGERARIEEIRLLAMEARMEADLALGRAPDVVGELEALCGEYPLRERFWALRMIALYRSGRQGEALRAYADARRLLIDELGIEPGPELQNLEAMVLAQDPGLGGGPGPVVGDSRHMGNLPAPLTRFVGRLDELARIELLLGDSRLVTLVGAGGAGKSRLAVQAAAAFATRSGQIVWLVELASVVDPAGVVPAFAAALGTLERSPPGPPPDAGSASLDALVERLRLVPALIVVDNCEHLVVEVAGVTEKLLSAVPALRILATSREALGVGGESLLPVGPLPSEDAIALFLDRARAGSPTFELAPRDDGLAQEVCAGLDGLPLAIELAAARLRVLPLAQLAARLGDRFRLLGGGARTALPRHQTLRAVVDWSYDLLFADEQRLFERVSVFVGGFSLEAAEEICTDASLPRIDVLDLLVRLVDKSLVISVPTARGVARFSQLQTLRQYGHERLVDSGQSDEVRSRHAGYYRHMAEEAQEGLRGANGPAWRERLTAELGNLRAALDCYLAAADAVGALSLAWAMTWLWFLNGDFAEGARWVGDALSIAGPAKTELRSRALAWHGYYICMSPSPAAGLAECDEAVDLLPTTADRVSRAEVLMLKGVVLLHVQEFTRSLETIGEVRKLLDADRDKWQWGAAGCLAATSLLLMGRLDEAEEEARASLEVFDQVGEVQYAVEPLNRLANIAEARRDLDGASEAYQAVLDRCKAGRQRLYIPFVLERLAGVRTRQGDDATADRLYDEAITSSLNPWVTADAMVGRAATSRRLGDMTRARALLDEAAAAYAAIGLDAKRVAVLAGLTWWSIAADRPEDALSFANDSHRAALASPDPAMQLLADAARAAANAVNEPTRQNTKAFLELAQSRARLGLAFGSVSDERDVADLAAQLVGDGH